MSVSFNRRRDACFLATRYWLHTIEASVMFQSQTRRLLPRNWAHDSDGDVESWEFQSQTRRLLPRNKKPRQLHCVGIEVSIADATLASSQLLRRVKGMMDILVSIADATLASSQLMAFRPSALAPPGFNRRRDACFLATWPSSLSAAALASVSIADATLASSQRRMAVCRHQ